LSSFIAAIGIPHVGNTLAKDLCNYIDSYEDLRNKVQERWDFTRIDGIGLEKQYAILSFDYSAADRVAAEMASWTTAATSSRTLEGMTIVITGRLTHFANRDAFINAITERGGRVVGSVSRNTTILVNNDTESNSSKNRTAKELGIPILSEEKFLAEYLLM
jgi:DNA ligase (NAD+)